MMLVEESFCCDSPICLERFKMVVLRSFSALISHEGDLLTLLSSISAVVVPILAPPVLPASLDNAFLSFSKVLLFPVG